MRQTARRTLATCALLACLGLAQVGTASAADSLWACFTVGGQPIPVSLAGLQATNRAGNWVAIDSVKTTAADGCVSYRLWGAYTRYNLRVITAGVTPDQQGLILGVSRLYAPGAYRGAYNLGRWEATVVRDARTDAWVDGGQTTSQSPAAMVAAFSDRLGPSLSGSVLCPHAGAADYDCDGVPDVRDLHWKDFRYH